MNDDLEKFPELFYDVTARIVPGAFLLGIYSIHDDKSFQGIGTLFFGLVFAYVLGYCVAIIAGLIIDRFIWHLLLTTLHRKGKLLTIRNSDELWDWVRANTKLSVAIKMKFMAERNLFRSLLMSNVIIAVRPPEILRGHYWAVFAALPITGYAFYRGTKILSKYSIKFPSTKE